MSDVGGAGQHGAVAAATAAHRAGFRGDDIATITMIAGRESKWRSDCVNPRTSDRGMWQINWDTLKKPPNDALRARLGINTDTDLLVLDTNAAVAWQMYQDSVKQGRPWHPWRGSDTGWKGNGPGWDGNGDHLWRTDVYAAESKAAAQAVLQGTVAPAAAAPADVRRPLTAAGKVRGSYTIASGGRRRVRRRRESLCRSHRFAVVPATCGRHRGCRTQQRAARGRVAPGRLRAVPADDPGGSLLHGEVG